MAWISAGAGTLGVSLAIGSDGGLALVAAAGGLAGAASLVWGLSGLSRRERALRREAAEIARMLGPECGHSADLGEGLERAATATDEAARLIESLRAAERDLRAMFDSVDAPVIATDARGVVLLANAAAAEFFGRAKPSLAGRRVEELFTQADLLDLLASARRGQTHSRQVPIPGPTGVRIFEVFASPLLRAAAEPGAIMTLRDVTEQARSVQVKTDFVVNASHELRTPIAALRMAAETLEGGAADDPVMLKRLLAMVSGHVGRLEDLTHDLLALSRLESPEVRAASEAVVASEIAEEMKILFAEPCRQRGLTLVFDLDPALEAMKSDRGLLLLILKNLIDNATKFANEGTAVRIVGRAVPNGDWAGARFEVIDRGQGIPLHHQDRIFERFYQIDEARSGRTSRRGTGLGLAIVKHAARTLGGQVRIQSVWKQGTTMIVEIPACVPPLGAHDDADAAPQRSAR